MKSLTPLSPTEDLIFAHLHHALAPVGKAIALQLNAALADLKPKSDDAQVGRLVNDLVPKFLEQEVVGQLLTRQRFSGKKRALLLEVLAAARSEPAAKTPGAEPRRQNTVAAEVMLTSAEAARRLHVSRTHLNSLVDLGEFGEVGVTKGGHRRIPEFAVAAYLVKMKRRQASGLRKMVAATSKLGLYDNELDGIELRTKA